MGFVFNCKTVLTLSVVTVFFGYKCWKGNFPLLSISKRRQEKEEEDPDEEVRYVTLKLSDLWNTVMFFPDYNPEFEESTTHQLIWYMEQSQKTLDICVYSLNFKMLEDALMRIARSGVRVRILTNKFTGGNRKWRRAGIQTRAKIHKQFNARNSAFPVDLMHHKFVIIDDWAILSGSLNFTMDSITANFDNVMVTTAPITRQEMQEEFNRLWKESVYIPGPITKVLVDPSHPDWHPDSD